MMVARTMEQIATPIGYTFVCYARDDEAFAITVAEAMDARGVPIWIDQWNIQPGANWSQAIDDGLNGCTNFAIVLSPAAVASEEVAGELHAALENRKRVIPLLYRPCEIPRRLRLKQHIDFTQYAKPTETAFDHLANVLVGKDRRSHALPTEQERKGRRTLVQDVSDEATARLRSLGADTPVSLRLEYQPHQVARRWDDEVVVSGRQRLAPAPRDVIEVFDDSEVAGKLLILGAPGSGKTTVMLQLMQQLVARAESDERQPVPVLISLASWKKDTGIGEWLVEELKIKHGVRVDLGARWRDTNRILPLLDALDEVPAEHQNACVEAINQFQESYTPSRLVVCCRRAEYENLTATLSLRGAVCLLPLSPDQIREYLHSVGCSDLWSAVSEDPELMEMAQSPLLLSFMTALPRDPEAERWQDAASATARRSRLFDAYVSSQSSPAGKRTVYSREQTLRWLSGLATTLKRRGQAEFLIERMQPDWFESSIQQWCYRAGVLIVSAVAVVVVAQTLLWLVEMVPRGNVGTALQQSPIIRRGAALINPVAMYVIAGVVGSVIAFRGVIMPVETLTWSWPRAWKNTRRWAQTATLTALDYALPVSAGGSLLWSFWMFDPPVQPSQRAGAFVGLGASACLALFVALIKPSKWLRSANRGVMKTRIAHAVIAAILFALVTAFTLLWSTPRDQILANAVTTVLTSLSVFAIIAFSAVSSDRVRVAFLTALTSGVLSGVAAGAIFGFHIASPAAPIDTWISVWMSGGVGIGLSAALMIGLTLRAKEWLAPPHSSSPAGERWNWRKTALSGLAAGTAMGLAAVLCAIAWDDRPIRNVALFGLGVQLGVVLSTVAITLSAIFVTAGVVILAAVLGALGGMLSGATGADVERRLVPNQGIRHSAVNVLVFAGLGTLIIGVPYGLLNLSIATVAVRTLPSPADWLRLCFGSGLPFGVMAGFLPGAACIQHVVLRLVLWGSGNLPLRFPRFLDFATRQRLLQRVGGRYRFIHVLLRDHLADAASAPARV